MQELLVDNIADDFGGMQIFDFQSGGAGNYPYRYSDRSVGALDRSKTDPVAG